MSELNVVLGASGIIGQEIIKNLKSANKFIRAVENSNKTSDVESVKGNLMSKEDAKRVLKGGKYIFICIGLKYESKIWEEQWPVIIDNILDSCEDDTNLIFLDNIYMYSNPLNIPFNEEHEQNPSTRKGKVRKLIADKILQAHNQKKINCVIGRSADFYGPNCKSSFMYQSFLENILIGKNPLSLFKTNLVHTFAYTQDVAKALVTLAYDTDTYGQVWHLPTSEGITFDEVLNKFNRILKNEFKFIHFNPFIGKSLSLFMPIIKELYQISYQYENNYIIDWNKFKKKYPDFKVTNIEDGISNMVKSFNKLNS